jgi:hypothetical protein
VALIMLCSKRFKGRNSNQISIWFRFNVRASAGCP